MKDYVNEYLPKNSKSGNGLFPYKRMECKGGFTMSVQVGDGLYCSPRINNGFPYRDVEVGFPNKKPMQKEFLRYAEDDDNGFFYHLWRCLVGLYRYRILKDKLYRITSKRHWRIVWSGIYTETVYGYIPVEIVNKEIELHGGLK